MAVSDQDCFVSQRRLRARAKKAIEQMQLRTLKEGDKVGLTLWSPLHYRTAFAWNLGSSLVLEQDAEVSLSL